MFLFVIWSKVPYLLNTFTSNATSIILKSNSSIATTNNLASYFIITTSIVQQINKLRKWIWQQTNEVAFEKTNSCKNTHLTKCTLTETQTYKGSEKIVNKCWKFKPNTLFLLWENKYNKHTMLYLYGTKDQILNLFFILS
jgi:hypothetical protein